MPFLLDAKKVSEFVLKLRESGSKETTIKNYEASLKRVLNSYKYSPINLVNTEEFVNVINKDGRTNTNKPFSLNTKKLMYATILKYLAVMGASEDLRAEWDDMYAKVKDEVMEIEKKNELKEGEKEKFMEYDRMKFIYTSFLEEVEYGEEDEANWDEVIANDPIGHFLLANLLLLPAPTRLGNYREMKKVFATIDNYEEKIAELDETSNYLVIVKLKTKTMYVYRFADYKTADAVGNVVVNVEERLLKRVIGTIAGKPKLWEQVIKASQPQQTKKLIALTKNVFGKEFSVDLIRHAYITWLYSNKPTAKEKQEALKIFGNKYNPTTADLYYRKV